MMVLTQIILMLVLPFLYMATGRKTYRLFAKVFSLADNFEIPANYVNYTFGLLIHLVIIFFLKNIGCPWWLAFFFPLLIFSFFLKDFSFRRPEISLNFVLWIFVILATGISLFQVVRGDIETAWTNNYGDLTFHLGMISSFVRGDIFPPQFHLYAGDSLSYPFFINLWSAALWWLSPDYTSLQLIFAYQWTILWCIVFFAFKGNRYRLLPWAIFFGGGSFIVLDEFSHTQISKGYPWSVFLTTIWVTQRAALFGASVLAVVLDRIYAAFEKLQNSNNNEFLLNIFLAGLILGLSPLVHAHICLVVGIFVGLFLLCRSERLYMGFKKNLTETSAKVGVHFFKARVYIWKNESLFRLSVLSILLFICSSALGLIFLPWLIGKAGMISFMSGWTVGEDPVIVKQWYDGIKASFMMWYHNIPYLYLCFLVFLLFAKKYLESFLIIVLFIFGNFVLLATWTWDQIKIFLAIYCIFLFCWSRTKGRLPYYLHYITLILCVPGIIEAYRAFVDVKNNIPFSKDAVAAASLIEHYTPADAIIAAAPKHNSPVLLSGRTMYLGYTGTLWSHNINYREREMLLKNLEKICNCRKIMVGNAERDNCPDYLFWNNDGKEYWQGQKLCPNLQYIKGGLYKINYDK